MQVLTLNADQILEHSPQMEHDKFLQVRMNYYQMTNSLVISTVKQFVSTDAGLS